MKPTRLLFSVLCLLTSDLCLQPSALCLPAADRTADWQAVADAQKAQQPQTATAALDRIITSALDDGSYPEALKALLQKTQTDATLEKRNDQPAYIIRALNSFLGDKPPLAFPPPMRPLLEAALAKTWWTYYQSNRWQLLQRTQTSTQPSDDFQTWDARRVLAETAKHFESALAAPAALQQTPIATLAPLLAVGDLPDTYRPTLYDFLIHEAIAFYSAGEQGIPAAENAFTPTLDSPILAPLEEFLAWPVGASLATPGSSGTGDSPVGSSGTGDSPVGSSGTGDSPVVLEPTPSPDSGPRTPDSGSQPLNPELRTLNSSPTLRALQLYQQLLLFHLHDPAPQLALADADLARLNWAVALLGNTDATNTRYQSALRAFIEAHASTEPALAAAASLKLAQLLENTDPAAAVAAAQKGIDLTPDSESTTTTTATTATNIAATANDCRNLIARVTIPALYSITTETTWPVAAANPAATTPLITVNYRNQTKIYFRACALDWKSLPEPGNASRIFKETLFSGPPEKSWSADLPPTPDFRVRDEKLPAPRDLKPGYYLIAASYNENFSSTKNLIQATTVWVGDIAILRDAANTTGHVSGRASGLVVNTVTGEPIVSATVSTWYDTRPINSSGAFATAHQTQPKLATTGTDGAFSISNDNAPMPDVPAYRFSSNIEATAPDGQTLAIFNQGYGFPDRNTPQPPPPPRVAFFTDRALYRPGQTIQFKAIVFDNKSDNASAADSNADNNYDYKPLRQRAITIVLDDPNRKEAARLELTTNGFGSATGSFTVPAGRLTGAYSLQTTSGETGWSTIRVEEYKRPKFEVTLPAPDTAPKLNETATLTGAATSYTGAPIDNAKVTWRVRRETRWPLWCWWFPPYDNRGSAEIAHGSATTDATGKFPIAFTALPDPTTDPADEPIFTYTITAEVTDPTGETRAATRSISIGHTALSADITVKPTWDDHEPDGLSSGVFDIKTTTLDNAPQTATGAVAIYALKQPATVPQPALDNNRPYNPAPKRPAPDINSPDTRDWPIDEKPAATLPFTTDAKTGLATIFTRLPPGIYRAILTTKDRFGNPVTAQTELWEYDETAPLPIKTPSALFTSAQTAQPGDTINAYWATGYNTARARISIAQNGKVLRSFWTNPGATHQLIPIEITEPMRGGITIYATQVRDNRLTTVSRVINVPWDNKKLKITWEHFNSKLTPGGRETWTAKITPLIADNPAATAELVAALYDASLDQFAPHNWPDSLAPLRSEYSSLQWTFSNRGTPFRWIVSGLRPETRQINRAPPYRYWDQTLFPYAENERFVTGYFAGGGAYANSLSAGMLIGGRMPPASRAAYKSAEDINAGQLFDSNTSGVLYFHANASAGEAGIFRYDGAPAATAPDLAAITARKNLSETAFFYPQLLTDPDGSVRIEFTAPEALTRWKFLAFAHDKQLRSALLTDTAVTAKDLMVQPNPPRFLREGDTVEFTVKVTNVTAAPQTGTAQLTFADATTLESVNLFADAAAENPKSQNSKSQINPKSQNPKSQKQAFALAANSSTTLSWRIHIPDGQGFLTYKAVASTGTVSDGEEGFLPVLSRRQLVTESIALPIRDAGARTFRFDKLAASATDTTLRNESLTVQMTSNPAWYAVLALPQLMEFPHECSEQLFNRYYANALAAHIANSDPKIARVFEQWRNTPALDSPLLKNDDLKSVLIEETPWLRTATTETESRRALATLFDANRTASQSDTILRTLAERQLPNGLWSWFPGGDGSDYITRYLVAGFARLRHFGIPLDARATDMLNRAVAALDTAFAKNYADLQKLKDFKPSNNYLTTSDAFQLYTRSFFLKDIPIPDTARPAYDYYQAQAADFWQTLPRQSQAHVALALARIGDGASAGRAVSPKPPQKKSENAHGGFGETALPAEQPATPAAIITSLRQRAKTSDELGVYWNDADAGWFWWQAPIETQSLMIELFDEVAHDPQAVSDLQLWLLKQKQTQSWPSTKATADAVYALLLRGADKLASDALVSVTLGDGSSGMGDAPMGSSGMADSAMLSEHGRVARATQPTQPEPGTGYYTYRVLASAITPAMGENITVTKTDPGPAWGSVTWQYFQTLDKITPHEGTPLTLKKTLWKQINTASGPTLVPIGSSGTGDSPVGSSSTGFQPVGLESSTGILPVSENTTEHGQDARATQSLAPGDTIIVRLELRTDRDMEFIHLKDQRGSGTEPINVLSGYRWKNGLGYYESTRDTATHFFIDRLPAGTYVFEYPIRIQLRGRYESGVAEIQCMYAPEYNSHSASTTLVVE